MTIKEQLKDYIARNLLFSDNGFKYDDDDSFLEEGIVDSIGVLELVAFVDDVVDDLGSRAEVEYVDTILSQGCSADRQLDCYHRDGDFRSVVEHVVQETAEGLA